MDKITKKPGKQRKMLFNAPYHKRTKNLSSHLSSDLRSSHGTRSIPIRTGDTVRILRGDRTGVEGKVIRVNRKKYQIFVEGVNREQADGTTVLVPIHPSKVEAIRLNLDDKRRKQILERRGKKQETQGSKEKTTRKRTRKVKSKKEKPKETGVE